MSFKLVSISTKYRTSSLLALFIFKLFHCLASTYLNLICISNHWHSIRIKIFAQMVSILVVTLWFLVPSLFGHCPFAWDTLFSPWLPPTHLFMTRLNVSISEKTSIFQADKVTSFPVHPMLFINNSTLTFTQLSSNDLFRHLSHWRDHELPSLKASRLV